MKLLKDGQKNSPKVGDEVLYAVSERVDEVMWREKKLFPNADFYHALLITSWVSQLNFLPQYSSALGLRVGPLILWNKDPIIGLFDRVQIT